MEVIKLALSNFKRFASEVIEFGSGLNLIWGPNESGKSTVHEAIGCALFGREPRKDVSNWNGGSCSVVMDFLSNGQTYRVERKLTESANRFGVLVDGEIMDAVTTRDAVASAVAEHLGVPSRAIFDNTVSVKQLDLSKPNAGDMEAVGSEIQRVLTGTAHISADEVRKRLEAARDAIKGRARPTNPREYDRITERLARLADDLADARQSRTQIHNLEQEQAELDVRIARDTERAKVLSGLLERHKRWSEIKKREAELNAQHESCYGTLRDIRHTVEDLALVQKELESYTELVGKDDEIAEHLTKIEGRREELEARAKELDAVGNGGHVASGRQFRVPVLAASAILAAIALVDLIVLHTRLAYVAGPASILLAVLSILRYAKTGGSGTGQIAAVAESVRDDLESLNTEEQSILSYMKCQDVGRAWAKIKNYRNMVSRARELEATLKGLMAGRTHDDWESQEADLARDLSAVCRELEEEFAGYSPSTEEFESWRSEAAALQSSLPTARERLHGVRGSLETERRNARDLAALEGELEYLHRRRGELEFAYKAYEEAISAIDIVTGKVSEEYLPNLSEQASVYLERLTSGRYTYVCIKPGWEITADCCDKTGVRSGSLSLGTLDQLYFALRLGCGELLSAGRKLPVILDDPFAAFDRQRLDNALAMLKAVAREHQVILLTHDPYILDWAKGLATSGDACMIHELPAPPV